MRLEPNETNIASKVLDGEAILIDLSNGFYYSMDGAGGFLWSLVEARYSVPEMVAELARAYSLPAENAQADVERLVAELERYQLIRLSNASAHRADVEFPARPGSYMPPLLNVYGDMNHLLAIDPPLPGLYDVPDQGQKRD